jgi:hypothetical protein
MTISTTAIHHASAVVVEAHKVVDKIGHVTKWLTFSIKNAEGNKTADFTIFDLELTDLVVQQDTLNLEEIAA